MKDLALASASFRELGFEGLEAALGGPDLAGTLPAPEAVVLATGERLEVYACGVEPAVLAAALARSLSALGLEVAADRLTVAAGLEAGQHLFSVASGLEGLVLGDEDAVRAVDRALAVGPSDRLAGLLAAARACADRVHAGAGLRGEDEAASVAGLAARKVARHFGPEGPTLAALIGGGRPVDDVAAALRGRPTEVLFADRAFGRAEARAERLGGRAVALEDLRGDPPLELELLFTTAPGPDPVLPAAALEPALAARRARGLERPLIACDLGVPRGTDPALDALPGALVMTMPRMEAMTAAKRAGRAAAIARAREIVAEEAARLERAGRLASLAETSARGMLKRRLAHLGPADQAEVVRLATGLAERIASAAEGPSGPASESERPTPPRDRDRRAT